MIGVALGFEAELELVSEDDAVAVIVDVVESARPALLSIEVVEGSVELESKTEEDGVEIAEYVADTVRVVVSSCEAEVEDAESGQLDKSQTLTAEQQPVKPLVPQEYHCWPLGQSPCDRKTLVRILSCLWWLINDNAIVEGGGWRVDGTGRYIKETSRPNQVGGTGRAHRAGPSAKSELQTVNLTK